MSDPERFDGDDGLALGELSELVGPDYRAELAEFIAQVRYALDDYDAVDATSDAGIELAGRLHVLVGPWPHEVKP